MLIQGIEFYEGKIGSGKTYAAALLIAYLIGLGATIVTNISINAERLAIYVAKTFGVEMQPDQLILIGHLPPMEIIKKFHTICPQGSREMPNGIVLDEIQIYFNSRLWSETMRANPDIMAFLTTIRHLHTFILGITQATENVDAQIRRLSIFTTRFRDLQKFTLPGLGSMWPFPTTLAVKYDSTDFKMALNRSMFMRKQEIFDLYDSHQLLTATDFSKMTLVRTMKKIPYMQRVKLALKGYK